MVAELKQLYHDMVGEWGAVTDKSDRPKLHALGHAAEFAGVWQALGAFNEVDVERNHAQFNSALDRYKAHLGLPKQLTLALRSVIDPVVAAAKVQSE
jgi:hypothetical protein